MTNRGALNPILTLSALVIMTVAVTGGGQMLVRAALGVAVAAHAVTVLALDRVLDRR